MTTEKLTTETDDWRTLLVDDRKGIERIIGETHRVAVLGIKPDPPGGAAFFVPEYMQHAGFDIVPVPVYFPDVTEILGEPVRRGLASVDPPADMVLVFRRSSDVAGHLDELLAARPRVVWMQQGIRNEAVAERLAKEGITVVQDRCMKVELAMRGR